MMRMAAGSALGRVVLDFSSFKYCRLSVAQPLQFSVRPAGGERAEINDWLLVIKSQYWCCFCRVETKQKSLCTWMEKVLRSAWSVGAMWAVALPLTMVSAVRWENWVRALSSAPASGSWEHPIRNQPHQQTHQQTQQTNPTESWLQQEQGKSQTELLPPMLLR